MKFSLFSTADVAGAGEPSAQDAADEASPGAPSEDPDFAMGGQAVLEGVMMRGPRSYAVAVRRPQGDIAMVSKPFIPMVKRKRWLRLPIARGAVSLVEMLILGFRALEYSANVAEEGLREEEEAKAAGERQDAEEVSVAGETDGSAPSAPDTADAPDRSNESAAVAHDPDGISRWLIAGVFLFSMVLGMGLFVVLPNATVHLIGMVAFEPGDALPAGIPVVASDGEATAAPPRRTSRLVEVDHPMLYNLISGGVRVCIIVAYIWLISLMKDIRRLFQYHGAEHKVVMAYEKKIPLDIEHIRPVTTLHPRCGTTFIAIVLLVSIVAFALLAALIVIVYPGFSEWSIWLRKPVIILMHIAFMPLIGGVAYEITRRAGRKPDAPIYRVLLAPGFAFQRITTRQPDDSMIEVALAAFREALEPRMLEGGPDDGAHQPA